MNRAPETLYTKDAQGNIRVWSIGVLDNRIIIEHGHLGGSLQTKFEEVPEGKASRTRDEQILSRLHSRINRQIDKGYLWSVRDLPSGAARNALNLKKPMLAKPLKDVKNINYENAYTQHKYDGNRCLITRDGDNLIAYTRNGKKIDTIDHILQGVHIEDGMTLDGELYAHGVSLQQICSLVKREQKETLNLNYHVYDLMEDAPYEDRLKYLNNMKCGHAVSPVPTMRLEDSENITGRFNMSKDLGYEGLILRWGDAGYEDGKRSRSLVKIKSTFDDYFRICDVHESKDGWGIFECLIENGDSFRVSPPGTMDDRYLVADIPEEYIGKMVRVEYANLTKDGIPFHPVATLVE